MFVLNAVKDPEYSQYLFPADNKVIWLGDFNWSAQLTSSFAQKKFKEFEQGISEKLSSAYHEFNNFALGTEEIRTFFDTRARAYFNDYIFVGKNAFEIESAFVGSEKEWASTDCDKTYSSDHCPVMAEVNLVH